MGIRKALGFGEYDIVFLSKELKKIKVGNELFNSKLVVKKPPLLLVQDEVSCYSLPSLKFVKIEECSACAESTITSHYSEIQCGHSIVGINDVFFKKMKKSDFDRQVQQCPAFPIVIRFKDEKRASMEIKIMEDVSGTSQCRILSKRSVDENLDHCQRLLWQFRLNEAESVLRTMSYGREALISLTLAEIALFRVLVSADTNAIKSAIQACIFAASCAYSIFHLPSIRFRYVLEAKMAYAEGMAMLTICYFFHREKFAAAKALRKSWNMYLEVKSTSDQLRKRYDLDWILNLQRRSEFGIGVSKVYVALLPDKLKWILSFASGAATDTHTGINMIQSCLEQCELRSQWAALALLNCRRAVRIGTNKSFDSAKLTKTLNKLQQKLLLDYPEDPLIRWAYCQYNLCTKNVNVLATLLEVLHKCKDSDANEQAHLIRADIALLLIRCARFDQAIAYCRSIAFCTTAPRRHQALHSVYYAACLAKTNLIEYDKERLDIASTLQSCKSKLTKDSLLRRGLQFLRLSGHVELLPFEAMYVHWQKHYIYSSMVTSSSKVPNECDVQSLAQLNRIGRDLPMPSAYNTYICQVMEDNEFDANFTSMLLERKDLSPFAMLMLAEWITIRGLILFRISELSNASKHFSFIKSILQLLPDTTYTVPISLFRLATIVYERARGFDPISTSILLLEQANQYNISGIQYEYHEVYASRIENTLSILQRAQKYKAKHPPVIADASQSAKRQIESVQEICQALQATKLAKHVMKDPAPVQHKRAKLAESY